MVKSLFEDFDLVELDALNEDIVEALVNCILVDFGEDDTDD